ncbi:hypothetical protein GSI_04185 [Ganoderma sinense ZZ0214-1]|uniref:Polyketide synthase-like phosphopantetheine-binding domain-containing protein n=1 Tax=Ganoderma sinense ZZ0214-1 TaxID=1077348 RepID=A0A2G8SIG9_9APHY|nr:hypothetical protein GSI_04185 [Ganoderma sinense ZZ0214-1]
MPLIALDLPAHISPNFRVPDELLKSQDTTLSQLYQWNAQENPNSPLFIYHDPSSAKLEYVTYSYSSANDTLHIPLAQSPPPEHERLSSIFLQIAIILSNGEKTNRVPLEMMIIDPEHTKRMKEYRNKIWATIGRVNDYAPAPWHSRIFKEMIMVIYPSKPFVFNAKGLPWRGIILAQYDEIEVLYKEAEGSARSAFSPLAKWDEPRALDFVRTVVHRTLRRTIVDNADIFSNGGNSLQATWIRNTLLHAIREVDSDAAKRLPTDLVFSAPTIAALAARVCAIVRGPDVAHSDSERTPQDLWRCDALEHLLRHDAVERVYAFNRRGADAPARQRKQMVEAVLHEPRFGVDAELLEEVGTSPSYAMLNAWKVDFNLSIASFEADMQGVRNFIDFTLSSPVQGRAYRRANCKIAAPVPEISIDDPASPFGTGYSESKWVA